MWGLNDTEEKVSYEETSDSLYRLELLHQRIELIALDRYSPH